MSRTGRIHPRASVDDTRAEHARAVERGAPGGAAACTGALDEVHAGGVAAGCRRCCALPRPGQYMRGLTGGPEFGERFKQILKIVRVLLSVYACMG
jgi:hypothetical protein